MVPERGLAQGDPGSPLGAAALAGAHARRVAAGHDITFTTYVDEPTMLADAPQTVEAAADALAYLDWLSGQEEDPTKLEIAAIRGELAVIRQEIVAVALPLVERIMKVGQRKQEPLLLVRKMCQQHQASRGPAE